MEYETALKESLSTTGLCARVLLFTPGLPWRGSHVWKRSKFFLSKHQLSTLSKMVDLSRELEMEDSAEEEMVENYYGSPVAISTRRLQAASSYSATSQPISVPLNRVVSRELDKLIYDILNESKLVYFAIAPWTRSCLTMCSKKSGKYRGCPCRDEGLRCHFTCKRGLRQETSANSQFVFR